MLNNKWSYSGRWKKNYDEEKKLKQMQAIIRSAQRADITDFMPDKESIQFMELL